jgi:hypothetical protein
MKSKGYTKKEATQDSSTIDFLADQDKFFDSFKRAKVSTKLSKRILNSVQPSGEISKKIDEQNKNKLFGM